MMPVRLFRRQSRLAPLREAARFCFPPANTPPARCICAAVCEWEAPARRSFTSTNPAAFPFGKIAAQAALFFGEDLEDVTIEGAGTVDGQAEYDWREDNFEMGFSHKESMQKLGKPLLHSSKRFSGAPSFPAPLVARQIQGREVHRTKMAPFTQLDAKSVHLRASEV